MYTNRSKRLIQEGCAAQVSTREETSGNGERKGRWASSSCRARSVGVTAGCAGRQRSASHPPVSNGVAGGRVIMRARRRTLFYASTFMVSPAATACRFDDTRGGRTKRAPAGCARSPPRGSRVDESSCVSCSRAVRAHCFLGVPVYFHVGGIDRASYVAVSVMHVCLGKLALSSKAMIHGLPGRSLQRGHYGPPCIYGLLSRAAVPVHKLPRSW